MAEKITASINVQVMGGPRLSESRTTEHEAYDKLHLIVPASESDLEVNIQPGGEGLAKFLVITASSYEGLSYRINAIEINTLKTPAVDLDGPHFFAGEGAVRLLYRPSTDSASPEPPTKLYFSNSGDVAVAVEILVARDATPGTS